MLDLGSLEWQLPSQPRIGLQSTYPNWVHSAARPIHESEKNLCQQITTYYYYFETVGGRNQGKGSEIDKL